MKKLMFGSLEGLRFGLLRQEYMLQKTLNEKLNEKLGKDTKSSNFSCKLKREHLTFKELKLICDILGYNLIIEKKKDLR